MTKQGAKRHPKIEAANRAALDVLKPSGKDLEHGLALHKDIVVVESYGFAPTGAPNPKVVNEALAEGASDTEFRELHEEMRVAQCVCDPREREEFQAAWRASGITAIFQNAGSGSGLASTMAHYCHVVDAMPEFVIRGTRPADIVAAKKARKHALLFSANGIPLVGDGSSVQGELRYLRKFFSVGFRQMHLTYNRATPLADGCAEPRNAGLTEFGRGAVAAMADAGIMVDVAHSGWRTSTEAARVSRVPIIASHTTCCGVHEHFRGKPDDAIKAVADGGGMIGLAWIPAFLGGSMDLNALLDHVDYLAKLVGVDHIGMGSDVVSPSPRSAAAWKKVKDPWKGRKRRQSISGLWPPGVSTGDVGWEMAREDSLAFVNRPYATVGLVQRGYSDDDIAKIMGGNHLRVFQAVLDGRKTLG